MFNRPNCGSPPLRAVGASSGDQAGPDGGADHANVDAVEFAARWAADQPGWIPRVLAGHRERPEGSGNCGACTGCRSVKWPCVLWFIATWGKALQKQAQAEQQRADRPAGAAA